MIKIETKIVINNDFEAVIYRRLVTPFFYFRLKDRRYVRRVREVTHYTFTFLMSSVSFPLPRPMNYQYWVDDKGEEAPFDIKIALDKEREK